MTTTTTVSRREFLQATSALGLGAFVASATRAWGLDAIENPLARYPGREWERVYRDLWHYDSTFTFLCAPNDTHNCILNAYVRSGVVTRIGPTMKYGEATDLDGNRASHRWDPRVCQKGLALTRRFYGDRRLRHCMVRKGFKQWVDGGFPRGVDGQPPRELFNRGRDQWVRVTHAEAAAIVAAALENIATTYAGEAGQKLLAAQGYQAEVVAATKGAGTQTLKFRGGMPLLGLTRVFGLYRLANAMALLDAKIRRVGPDAALGGRGFDNYSWHTDLPPGHPMVTGQQTVEFDLSAVELCRTVVVWGMNWITTKMPDAHWLTEARLKGTRVVVIACEYSATSSKADDAIVVRPGTTPALALGLANVVLREKLYDADYVRRWTDLPILVRMDSLKYLRAADVFGGEAAGLSNQTKVLAPDEKAPPPGKQSDMLLPAALRKEWGDYVWWDASASTPKPLTRDEVGTHSGVGNALLEGTVEVTLHDGSKVRCRPVFDLVREYAAHFDPKTVEEMTWAPATAVERLARDIAKHPGTTLFAIGMGPNQFFNNDNKDRDLFLLAALTGNVGRLAGNVGSFAGNYRVALFNGVPQYINENPFDLELDPAKPARPKQYWKSESAHYYNHEHHILKVGNRTLTGEGHIPTPTKSMWFANANSILGNVKWHYNTVVNVLPTIEMIAVNEWWWSTSCEWADVVFAVDSWAELKHPDLSASVTNPFITVFPATPLARPFETRGDIEVLALVAQALAERTGDQRFRDCFKFVDEGRVEAYLQRILDASACAAGYRMDDLHDKAKRGIPALLMSRTYPKAVGYEQVTDSRPWYTKSGRLEFYRDEDEFIEAGENLPVHREPIDSTFYEPNVIVAPPHEALRPKGPKDYGVPETDLSCETRQGRNVVKTWAETKATKHPLADQGYRFVFHTPKYRHGAHTMPIDTDMIAMLFGPFGDIYRHDQRSPFVAEGYVDINPDDGRGLGVEDGDYVWVDSDPADRPFRGWQENAKDYAFSRLLCRARYYPGTPRGITRMWFNMYGATPGSVEGQQARADGLAKNPRTNYQAMFRSGSHQSATRGWLKPTLMTDSLVRKELLGQQVGKGFLADVHCPTGAPRESIVKITKAEPGGLEGKGLWRPAKLGLRPGYETDSMKRYLAGDLAAGDTKKGGEGLMARVHNWQINRDMSYWYPEARPTRQFAAVFDTNKCISCQTCTVACKTTWTSGKGQEYMLWNNVETKPYGFYPLAWDLKLLEKLGPQTWSPDGAYEGRTLFEAAEAGERVLGWRPEDLDYAHPNVGEDDCAGGNIDSGADLQVPHDKWFFYLARICNHCTYPGCLASCPRASIYKRPEDGIVLIDQERCRGYQECVKACPYKKVFYNPMTGTSEKCIACFPKFEQGLQPQCFVNCIGKIRFAGHVSTPAAARADNPLDYLVHVRKVALPLYPQWGLEPNVYYVPPIHVPRRFLYQMFGPQVDAAIDTYRGAADDPDLAALFCLFGATERVMPRWKRSGDTVIGMEEDGTEIVRVPVREPVFIRQAFDTARGVTRTNTP